MAEVDAVDVVACTIAWLCGTAMLLPVTGMGTGAGLCDGSGSSKLATYWSRLLINDAVNGLKGATG